MNAWQPTLHPHSPPHGTGTAHLGGVPGRRVPIKEEIEETAGTYAASTAAADHSSSV